MLQTYQKCVIGRSFLKTWTYERLNVHPKKLKEHSQPMTDVELSRAYYYRQRAKKEKLMHLADVNFIESGSSFVTLTFADNVTEYETATKEFKLFCKRVRRKFKDIRYIATVETQKRGALHFHILLNVPCEEEYVDTVRGCWKVGVADVKEVFSVKGCVLYMCKGFIAQERNHALYNKRCYFLSQRMEQCIKIDSWKNSTTEIELMQSLTENETLVKRKAIKSEYAGLVEYKEYQMGTDYFGMPKRAELRG